MPIMAYARPAARTTPTRRMIVGYVGTVAGLRAALAAATQARPTIGGAR